MFIPSTFQSSGDEAPGRGPVILVADRAAVHRQSLADALSLAGYRIQTAESGPAVLMMLQSEKPALLLIDEHMPDVSGLEILRELRAGVGESGMPIILMGDNQNTHAEVCALEAGADDYITRPINMDILAARIARLLIRSREHMGLRQAVSVLDARVIRRSLEIEELQAQVQLLSSRVAEVGLA